MSKYRGVKTQHTTDLEKLEKVRQQYRYKCACGWYTTIYPFEKNGKKICRNCGHYVYASKQEEFKDKLKGKMK